MKYSFTLAALAAVASAQEFTSIFNVTATPDQVIATTQVPAPGQPGAKGTFTLQTKTELHIHAHLDKVVQIGLPAMMTS